MKPISLDQCLGPVVRIGKKEYLFFSGTSYLGMEADRHYEAVLQDCIRQYGANHGLSRVNNVRLKVFEEFEKFFAKNAKAEAAAVMSSALIELSTKTTSKAASQYLALAQQQLTSLSSPNYTAKVGENGNFILMHSVGNMPANSEVNVPINYADYYYLEALLRYRRLKETL